MHVEKQMLFALPERLAPLHSFIQSPFQAITPLQNMLHPHLNIQRTICRSHIANTYQQHINQCPYSKSTKAEEFSQTFPPLAQIETISTKSTKGDAIGIKTLFIIIFRETQSGYPYALLSNIPMCQQQFCSTSFKKLYFFFVQKQLTRLLNEKAFDENFLAN